MPQYFSLNSLKNTVVIKYRGPIGNFFQASCTATMVAERLAWKKVNECASGNNNLEIKFYLKFYYSFTVVGLIPSYI